MENARSKISWLGLDLYTFFFFSVEYAYFSGRQSTP